MNDADRTERAAERNGDKPLLWRVKTRDGRSQYVEAYTADGAIAKAGVTREDCVKWSPFPLKTVPKKEEP